MEWVKITKYSPMPKVNQGVLLFIKKQLTITYGEYMGGDNFLIKQDGIVYPPTHWKNKGGPPKEFMEEYYD